MKPKAAKFALGSAILVLSLVIPDSLRAQIVDATLSGSITNPSGGAVANARVVITNAGTGQSTETQTNSTGLYTVPNLPPGDYEVSVSAQGFDTKVAKVTLPPAAKQTMNLALGAGQAQQPTPGNNPAAPAANNLPNAPSSSKTAPSLEDLGFPKEDSQANAKQQALLDKRTHMLKIHQRMGLITIAPLLATLVTSVNAGGKSTSTTSRNVHTALGAVTGDLYGITAYYAIRAPKIPGTVTRGPIKVHKALAWIHGPGMILTPILGILAYEQKSDGQKVHGIASAHGAVAIVTAGAFGAAVWAVAVKF